MLFIIGIFLKLPAFFESSAPVIKPRDSYTYRAIIHFIEPLSIFFPAIYSIIAFLLIFLQAYLLTFFVNNNRLMNKANFLPGMAYMLVTSLLPEFNVLSSPLIVSTFFISLFIILFPTHNQNINRGNIFNAGLILGLAGLIFLPSVLFLIWVYVALATLRPFKLNEWLLLLMGAVTPYYFLVAILYLNDDLHLNYFYNGFSMSFRAEKFTIWHACSLFLVLTPLFAGVYYIQNLSGRMLIHVRKAWNLFILYAIVCVAITFFNVGNGTENWFLALLPFAALHGFGYFNAELKIYPKIAFWLTIGFIICSQIFSTIW